MMRTSKLTTIVLGVATGLLLAAGCGEVTATDNTPDAFAPVMDPTISALSPDHGPLAGGTTVTVTGTGFLANDAGTNFILVGNTVATDVTVIDDTTLTFVTPAALADGPADLTVINGAGFINMTAAWSYNPLPVVTAVTPPTGSFGGNEIVTLTGSGFKNLEAGTITVSFGGAAATNVQATSDTTITLRTPPSAGAPFERVRVSVENANGEAIAENAYGYRKSGYFVGTNRYKNIGSILFMDPTTLETTEIMRLPDRQSINSIQPGAGDNLIVTTRGYPGKAYDVDPYSKIAMELGDVGLLGTPQNDTLRDLVKVNTAWYGVGYGRLTTVNPTTWEFSYVNATNWTGYLNPVAIAPRDANSMWIASKTTLALGILNLGTGTISAGPAFTSGTTQRYIQALAPRGGQLIAVFRGTETDTEMRGPTEVWSLNPQNGALTRIGVGPDGADALFSTPY